MFAGGNLNLMEDNGQRNQKSNLYNDKLGRMMNSHLRLKVENKIIQVSTDEHVRIDLFVFFQVFKDI